GSITPPAAADLDKQADLRAKALKAEAAESRGYSTLGAFAPKVSVVGGYQWYNNVQMDVNDLGDYRTAYQLGLQLDWNLFSGGASLAEERQASAQAEQARQASRLARQQAEYDRELWSRRLAYSTELYQAKLDDVDKSKESVRLATLGQQAGTRTTTEVLDAELDSFRASAGAVSAQMDAAEALINLELAQGQGDLP
ncbi:MAG TPA: TolC family protein, partial [bacterium]|nr:TolC family protein [bacterium]